MRLFSICKFYTMKTVAFLNIIVVREWIAMAERRWWNIIHAGSIGFLHLELPALNVCCTVEHRGQRRDEPLVGENGWFTVTQTHPNISRRNPCCLICAVSILRWITPCFGLSQTHFSSILLSVMPLYFFSCSEVWNRFLHRLQSFSIWIAA